MWYIIYAKAYKSMLLLIILVGYMIFLEHFDINILFYHIGYDKYWK